MSEDNTTPLTAYGQVLPIGPDSTPLAIEHTIGAHRYTLWRYGDADLQAPAEVWAIRDDGRRLTIDTAHARVHAAESERREDEQPDDGWAADCAVLLAAARAFHTMYDRREHKRLRLRRQEAQRRQEQV